MFEGVGLFIAWLFSTIILFIFTLIYSLYKKNRYVFVGINGSVIVFLILTINDLLNVSFKKSFPFFFIYFLLLIISSYFFLKKNNILTLLKATFICSILIYIITYILNSL